jgi:hypothetical protein
VAEIRGSYGMKAEAMARTDVKISGGRFFPSVRDVADNQNFARDARKTW